MGSQVRERDEMTVLVTGFGPFRAQYPVNPSWEIAKGLPEYLPPLRAKDPSARAVSAAATMVIPPVRIRVHPEPIRVSYEVVRELVPKLWSDAGDRGEDDVPDIVLHIGMAGPRPFYQIERRGHREGYRSPDVDGRFLEDEEEGGHGEGWIWYGCPDELETQLDMPDVLERWKTHSPESADIRISDDAGRYLCDFIYYSSLAHRWRQGKSRPVTFLHVPADASDRAVETGRELAIGLIRSLVESEVEKRRRGKGVVRRVDGADEGTASAILSVIMVMVTVGIDISDAASKRGSRWGDRSPIRRPSSSENFFNSIPISHPRLLKDFNHLPSATMCKKASCDTCNKSTWWGCGSHIAMVMDTVPEDERCTCEPKVESDGKSYPPKAKSP